MNGPSDHARESDDDPRDPLADAERRQVVDDYDSQVHGDGAATQVHLGGTPPDADDDERARRPDAAPPTTGGA